jgi:hypothetical protein
MRAGVFATPARVRPWSAAPACRARRRGSCAWGSTSPPEILFAEHLPAGRRRPSARVIRGAAMTPSRRAWGRSGRSSPAARRWRIGDPFPGTPAQPQGLPGGRRQHPAADRLGPQVGVRAPGAPGGPAAARYRPGARRAAALAGRACGAAAAQPCAGRARSARRRDRCCPPAGQEPRTGTSRWRAVRYRPRARP